MFAQSVIKGIVKLNVADSAYEGSLVTVKNVNTSMSTQADSLGQWSITVKSGNLLEFSAVNLETVRVRIVNEKSPKYYFIAMKPKVKELTGIVAVAKTGNYTQDSLNTIETYKTVFNKPLQSEYTTGAGILAGLSKKQREEWAFRENVKWFEEQKYIDSKFSNRPIARMTGLQGDSLSKFIELYRPSYYDLRQMTEYKYLLYVKTSLAEFCSDCVFAPPNSKLNLSRGRKLANGE
jgi:hypothetical protein